MAANGSAQAQEAVVQEVVGDDDIVTLRPCKTPTDKREIHGKGQFEVRLRGSKFPLANLLRGRRVLDIVDTSQEQHPYNYVIVGTRSS